MQSITIKPRKQIEVRAGNLGTARGFGTPVIVRVIKRKQIEITYIP